MRIVFIGKVDFCQHCLKEILKNRKKVVSVLTPTKEHADFHSNYTDLSVVAIRLRMEYAEAFT